MQDCDGSLVNGVHAKEQKSHTVRGFHELYVVFFCRNGQTADLQNKS
jgi:hypothetical protein